MPQFDPTDFVDSELEAARKSPFSSGTGVTSTVGDTGRALSRDEIDSKVSEAQVKLAELKRAQEELERERLALEETRRRQNEFQKGREEMIQSLTRGLGLLEKAEFDARREAEEMSKATTDLKEAVRKLQAIREESWPKDTYNTDLTKALTEIENARMGWNAARLKFAVLSDVPAGDKTTLGRSASGASLAQLGFKDLFKLGLAFTWPLVVLGAAIVALLLVRK